MHHFGTKFFLSITLKLLLAVLGILVWASANTVCAQALSVHISLTSPSLSSIRIEAVAPVATDTWSFRNTYAGVLGLGERVEKFQALGANAETIATRELAPGEFRSAEKVVRFTCNVNLGLRLREADMSHVSWLSREQGLLMLADLLPQNSVENSLPTSVRFTLPAGWTVASGVTSENGEYLVREPDKAVFLVGPALREKSKRIETTNFSLVSANEWAFSDGDAMKIASKIIKHYSKLTGFRLREKTTLILVSFPEAGAERWSAETRGNVIVLLLGRRATREQLLGKLGVVLSHEVFHLWVPNSLKLAGDYDWFFEGFTLYLALRTAQQLRLISFTEYLDTVARVYDSYRATATRDQFSLIEASGRRWTGPVSLVYDKGMLVAFLYDLALRNATEGQASIEGLYHQLFQLTAERRDDANEVIINLLNQPEGLKGFSQRYVQSATEIGLEGLLVPYGLTLRLEGGGTRFAIAKDLDKRQQTLLRSLGYRP